MAGQVKREAYVMPQGYKCPKCKAFNCFALWVYAHWDIFITHKCACGHEATLLRGKVVNE